MALASPEDFASLTCGAPGRKEIVTFFYMYLVIEFLAIFLDSGIIPTASTPYPVSRRALGAI